MSTPLSTSTSYCTPAAFTARYDYRVVGELLQDTDDPAAVPLTKPQVEAHADLAELLLASSGELEAACLAGARYRPTEDLAALTGGAASLRDDIISDLTMWRLFRRRPLRDPNLKPPTACVDAREMLQQLRDGERIFGTEEHAAAGVTKSVPEVAQDVRDRNGIAVQARRLYGKRGWDSWE